MTSPTTALPAAASIEAVGATHLLYDAFRTRWQRCRDCVDGEDAVKAAGERYLPKLIDEDLVPGAYDSRRARAVVYDAADRTLDSLLGALFRSPVEPTLPDVLAPQLENIDLSGTPYDGFKTNIASEVLEVGRFGVLVDWSQSEKRPFWIGYDTEQIRNWAYGIRGNKTVLEQVILFEAVSMRAPSGYGAQYVPQYRILELTEAGSYQARLFRLDPTQNQQMAARTFTEVEVLPGTRQGVSLTEIPFVCFGRVNLSLDPQKPPLLSICNLQLDHYRLSADVKHAMHFGALPTLVVIGDDDEKRAYHLGTAKAIKLPQGADAKFIEYSGGSVEQIRQEMLSDEQRMALLGARLLLAPKREAETAEALKIQREGETASLSTIAQALTRGLTKLWQLHTDWMGLPSADVKDEVKLDVSEQMTPQELAAQLQAVQAGHLSAESFIENLFAAGIAREPDLEQERLASQAPADQPQPAEQTLGMPPPADGAVAA